MLAPLSWLKEYVDVALKPAELGERLTEVGLGTEKITKTDKDFVFELEITPNRPDLLSILGVAREVAAIENPPSGEASKKIKYPKLKIDITKIRPEKVLPLEIKTDSQINPRFTGIIIDGITVKESPLWLKEKLISIGQRPINNIVDITNYVMFELGNPIHAFDYDKIEGHVMTVEQTKGGETFKSVDDLTYRLPKNAVVIRDKEKIIDLCGIKGGFNSGTFPDTKSIFLRFPVEDPILIRKTSQAMGLRSEASSIFERGVNAGGTIEALKRTVSLILELAGGEVASKIYDLKKSEFLPWKVELRLSRLDKILGIKIKEKEVINLLERLNLSPKKLNKDTIVTTVPTYRNDLKIEEDLIEEVARLYGYNRFPKTLPMGQPPTQQIPYFKENKTDQKIKNNLAASGFTEIYTYSLISENDLSNFNIDSENVLRVDNPVSRDFEYLRPTLKIGLIKALKQNVPNFKKVDLFELGKVYLGKTLDHAKEEYFLSGVSNNKSFYEIKGILERLFDDLEIKEDPTSCIKIIEEGILFELNLSEILNEPKHEKTFKPVAKYPPIIEDLAFIISQNKKTGEIIDAIKKQSQLIVEVSLLDLFKETRTFHIVYRDDNKNLTNEEITQIREKIINSLKEKFDARLKE